MAAGRFVRLLVVLSVVTMPACASSPATEGGCQDVRMTPADGGFYAAFGWDAGRHAYGDPVPLKVCIGAGNTTAALSGPAGIAVTPARQSTGGAELVTLTFQVTVDRGAAGQIVLTLGDPRWGGASGPSVAPDGDGWKFTRPPAD